MKRMIQGLTLPMAEHQRENMDLSATTLNFPPSSHDDSRLPRNEMHCRMQNGSILHQ